MRPRCSQTLRDLGPKASQTMPASSSPATASPEAGCIHVRVPLRQSRTDIQRADEGYRPSMP